MPIKPPENNHPNVLRIEERTFVKRIAISIGFLLIQSVGTTIVFTWSLSIPFLIDDLLLGWFLPTLPPPLKDITEMVHKLFNSLFSPFKDSWESLNKICKALSGLSPVSILPITLVFLYPMFGSQEEVELLKQHFENWETLNGEDQMVFLRDTLNNQGLSSQHFTPTILLFAYLISVIFFLRRTRKIIFEVNRDAPLTNTHRAVEKNVKRFLLIETVEFSHNQKSIPFNIKRVVTWSFIPGILFPVLIAFFIVLL
ncbi:MAG: hypothetical protein ACFFCQ_18825 [Promethearchaeota archaeon]